jgi:hypothetical protein
MDKNMRIVVGERGHDRRPLTPSSPDKTKDKEQNNGANCGNGDALD